MDDNKEERDSYRAYLPYIFGGAALIGGIYSAVAC